MIEITTAYMQVMALQNAAVFQWWAKALATPPVKLSVVIDFKQYAVARKRWTK